MQPNDISSSQASDLKRRVLAVLMTDVSNYTRNVARAEESAVARVRKDKALMKEVAAQHGGTIAADRGDGWKITFESTVEAAKAAIEIQRALRQRNDRREPHEPSILHRMGLHMGDVVWAKEEESEKIEITGAAVAIAARLESKCPPGQVAFTEDVANEIRRNIAAAPMGFLAAEPLKGLPGTTRIWATKLGGDFELGGLTSPATHAVVPAADRRAHQDLIHRIEEVREEARRGQARYNLLVFLNLLCLMAIAVWVYRMDSQMQARPPGAIPVEEVAGPTIPVKSNQASDSSAKKSAQSKKSPKKSTQEVRGGRDSVVKDDREAERTAPDGNPMKDPVDELPPNPDLPSEGIPNANYPGASEGSY